MTIIKIKILAFNQPFLMYLQYDLDRIIMRIIIKTRFNPTNNFLLKARNKGI